MTGSVGTAGALSPTHHHARWAWIWLALTPVGVLLGLVVIVSVYGLLGVDWSSTDQAAWWENAVTVLAGGAVIAVPPAFGVRYGLRAMHDGSMSGRAAAIVSGLVLAFVAGMVIWDVISFESAL